MTNKETEPNLKRVDNVFLLEPIYTLITLPGGYFWEKAALFIFSRESVFSSERIVQG